MLSELLLCVFCRRSMTDFLGLFLAATAFVFVGDGSEGRVGFAVEVGE